MTHADIIHLPLAVAWLCIQCSTVSNDAHRCPSCANEHGLLNLASVLDRGADDGWIPVSERLTSSHAVVDGSAVGFRFSGDTGEPLAQGTEARALRLRGYGDGIVAPLAVEFIRCAKEAIKEEESC